jgi:hypothetical protein
MATKGQAAWLEVNSGGQNIRTFGPAQPSPRRPASAPKVSSFLQFAFFSVAMAILSLNWQSALILSSLLAAYVVSKALYRLFFHPLATFPGPKLAALTYKYELYFDGIQTGQYNTEISRMHQQYGTLGDKLDITPTKIDIGAPRTNCPHQPR